MMTMTRDYRNSLRNVGFGLAAGAALGLMAVAAEAAFLLLAF